MRNRLRHIIITFLIATIVGLGSVQAGVSLCSADCVLCAAPAAVSCCDAVPSADHEEMISVRQAAKSSTADCPHGELCSVMNYPTDAGITSSNLFDDTVLLSTAPVIFETSAVTYLQSDVLPHQPPDHAFPPLYIRNCSYLI